MSVGVGFHNRARFLGEALYPSLWNNLSGLWVLPAGNTRTTAFDLSGKGSHGTLTNTEDTDWQLDRYGWQVDLDGTNERINIGDTIPLDISASTPFSIWTFCKPDTLGASALAPLLNSAYDSSPYYGIFAYAKHYGIGGGITLSISSTTSYYTIRTTDGDLPTGSYSSVVFNADGTNTPSGLSIFVNGVKHNQTTVYNVGTVTGDLAPNGWRIGGDTSGVDHFDGKIVAAGLWTGRTLTRSEMRLLNDPFAVVRPREMIYGKASAAAAKVPYHLLFGGCT